MPRLIHQNPQYRKHRASGQAVVTLDGRDLYLGPHGTKASRGEYDRLIGEWLANGRRLVTPATSDKYVTELVEAFWAFAESYYGGNPQRGELGAYRMVLKLLRTRYGNTFVREFRPSSLKAVRQAMIDAGWARTFINRQAGRVRRVFQWGVESEIVPAEVLQALGAVAGLRRGKTEARESDPVKPVPDALVAAVRPYVSPQVWAMIQLQLVTGMRPGEVCAMRGCDIDTAGKLWVYRPTQHKTAHHGHKREVYLGENAQAIIRPFLKADVQAHLFSPADAEAERRAKLSDGRTTPKSCGNRPGTNVAKKPARVPGNRYSVDAYRRAIERACDLAFPVPDALARQRVKGKKWTEKLANGKLSKSLRWESVGEWRARLGDRWGDVFKWKESHRWHPHQLRHNAGTRFRKQYGLEAAQVMLGQKTLSVTQIYAEKNVEAAMKIMGEVG
jgi:integrase